MWRVASLLIAAVQIAGAVQPQGPTIAELAGRLGANVNGIPTAVISKRLTSYETLTEAGTFVIAGYEDRGDGRLSPPLYVALKEGDAPWRLTTVVVSDGGLGSVTRLNRAGSNLFVGLHLSPSAVDTLVFRRDLTTAGAFYGWFLTAITNELVVFHRSMVHFAPAHAGELGIFDLATNRESLLYPTDTATPRRKQFIERMRGVQAAWQARDPKGNPYGFNPEWFDVAFSNLSYDGAADALSFIVTFVGDRHPPEVGPPLRESVTVTCREMRSPRRSCDES